jgi:hypothetical protein
MKRLVVGLACAVLLVCGAVALAHEGEHGAAATKAKQATLTGEVVDTGCYLGSAEKGAKHQQCAALCIQKGMPMGLLTSAGDLYLLVPPHSNAEAYKKLKEMAAQNVEVTGTIMERNGMKSIEVASARRPPAKTTP